METESLAIGHHKDALRENIEDYCGDGYHVLLTCNGTAACYLAVMALQLPPKSRIVVPATTYVATANAIVHAGHVPVFEDVDARTWCIRYLRWPDKYAFMVDLYGVPASRLTLSSGNYDAVQTIADCCESLGSITRGVMPSIAECDNRIAVTSFYGSKTLTCGEGGALITSDDTLYERARRLCEQGHVKDYVHDTLAWNFRMSNLNAALLYAQWQRREEIFAAKNCVRTWYESYLSADIWHTRQRCHRGDKPVWWANAFLFANRDAVRKALAKANVETRLVFPPLYEHAHLAQYKTQPCPVAEQLRKHGLILPSGATLTEALVERVCKVVNRVARPAELKG